MIDEKKIGRKIQEIRKSHGYTQEELADILGYGDRNKLSRIENGWQSMTANEFIDFCNKMDVSLDVLLDSNNLSSKEFIELGNRYINNIDISSEEKKDVIKNLYIQVVYREFDIIDAMCQKMDINNKNTQKSSDIDIDKYSV